MLWGGGFGYNGRERQLTGESRELKGNRGAYCGKMEEALAYRPERLKDCVK